MNVFYEFSKKLRPAFRQNTNKQLLFYVPSKYTKISVRKVASALGNINVSR